MSAADRLAAVPEWAGVVARETIATLRSACYPLARLHPLPVPRPEPGRRPVVLVHGLMAHPDVMRPLARTLLQRGWSTVVRVGYPSLGIGFEEIVWRVGKTVVAYANDGPVDLVGHSLGGVACRAFLKEAGGSQYVRRFVALGAPFGGTLWYRFAPRPFQEALDPEGPWVKRLSEGPEPVPTTVIRSHYDQQVRPTASAGLPGTPEVVIRHYGHNGLLWHPSAHAAVVDALLE